MTIILCIDFHRKPINWESPVLPRIGEKLFTGDFFPGEELSQMEDYLIVRDVIWHKEKEDSKEYSISLLLDYQE